MPASDTVARYLSQLASSDRDVADRAGDALMRAGSAVVPDLVDAFDAAPFPARRRLAFLLGRISAGPPLRSRVVATLLHALDDEDWKVRRNAAISLGTVADASSSPEMIARVEREADARVRASLLLAVGTIAPPDALPRLRDIDLRDEGERDAARKACHAIEGRAGVRSRIAATVPIPADVTLELWTRRGVADIAAAEARLLGMEATDLDGDRVRLARPESLEPLFRVRAALFPVLVSELRAAANAPDQAGREFRDSPVARCLQQITDPPVTYRLTVNIRSAEVRRRRDWIAAFAAAAGVFENRATAYAWDIILREVNGRLVLGARPASVPDTRFAYRVQDVPASVHPTLAAAAVRLVTPSAGDVVVDPFCGAGTLLAERAILGSYQALYGFDNHPRAIAAARANLGWARAVSLEQSDFSAFARLTSIAALITNPPYGQRVAGAADARALHAQLDDLARRALRPGGWLVVFRPVAFPSPTGLQVMARRRVDAGGLAVDLIVARRS